MKPTTKKWLIAIGIILLLFIITNPSISAFKAYEGSNTYYGLKRKLNFFVCSVYTHQHNDYLGVCGNFIDLKPTTTVRVFTPDSAKEADSARMAADTVKTKLTVDQFAEKIKEKYPEYRNLDNKTLVRLILKKYPVYKNDVILN